MRVLVDTNILLRLIDLAEPLHSLVDQAVHQLFADGAVLCMTPQNLYEFWVVATRSTEFNGLGRTPEATAADLLKFKEMFAFLDDTSALYTSWENLVISKPVLGRKAHDARLVAAMMVHGLGKVLTLNPQDFQGYPGILALTPGEVAAT